MRKLCLKNGQAVIDEALLPVDICIEDGKIVAIGNADAFGLTPDDEVVDCSGKIILPGVIDAHCHIQLDTGIFATQDDWRSSYGVDHRLYISHDGARCERKNATIDCKMP